MPPLIVELVPGPVAGLEDKHTLWRIPYTAGQTLAQAVYLSGRFAPPVLCSGLALCGRCRVRILPPEGRPGPMAPEPTAADRRYFSEAELALGWRLGCRHFPRPLLRLELPPEIHVSGFAEESLSGSSTIASCERGRAEPGLNGATRSESAAPGRGYALEQASFGLALDLGTTTLEWALFPLRGAGDGESVPDLWRGGCVNPQMGAGSDVLSRLAFARKPEGGATLHKLTVNALRGILAQGLRRAREAAPAAAISEICLAGNPAMTALALNLDVTGLAAAPYALPERGCRRADLPGLPPLWIPPQLSPFVGGDIAAGYAALALDPAKPPPAYPFLLADMGTNGEFLLALSPDKALVASVALGPALEGSGLRMGSEARPGAVTGFALRPDGLVMHTGGGKDEKDAQRDAAGGHKKTPPGITGTGYLSLLHFLLQGGIVDGQGHFKKEGTGPLQGLLPAARDFRGESYLQLPHGLRLHASDIEELLKVKAAFSLGLRRLFAAAGLASRDLARVYLAGALGQHVDKAALESLGFFPPGMTSRLSASGNSALAGAKLLLLHPPARQRLCAWAARVETVDLASDPSFTAAFSEHMRFCW